MPKPHIAPILLLLLGEQLALAEKPQIAHVFPDFPDAAATRVIVGEGFDPQKTEAWQWMIKADDQAVMEAARQLGAAPLELPAEPPREANRVSTLDREPQVLVADVPGDVLWLKTAEGFSAPYLLSVPKPFWVSHASARPGELVHMYGFGLRVRYRTTRILLKGPDRELPATQIVEARSPRTPDPRLVYFEVPKDAPAGSYGLYVHNGCAGRFGWVKAGDLAVTAPEKVAESRPLDVRTYGARGDGLANDRAAIEAAIHAAVKAGGGTVFFPPGTYRFDETITVPPGVILRGASRDTTILQGFGYDPHRDRVAWFTLPKRRRRPSRASATTRGWSRWRSRGRWARARAARPRSRPCPRRSACPTAAK